MCEPTTIALGLMAITAAVAAKSAYDQNKVIKATAKNNAIMAEYAAQDAEQRGEQEAARINRERGMAIGAERAALSAKGLDIDFGSAADIIDQTDFFGQVDSAQARTNGRRDAWAARAQRADFMSQADNARPGEAAFTSLLGSAGSVAGSWYARGGGGGKTARAG